MWHAPKNTTSEGHIWQEHLNVLWKAVADAGEFDPRTSEVYATLDYLQKRSTRTWGFTVFKEGLEKNAPDAMRRGFEF